MELNQFFLEYSVERCTDLVWDESCLSEVRSLSLAWYCIAITLHSGA